MKKIKAVIWDYNGTLLDDMEIAIKSINAMLAKRRLPLLTSERYREVFTFPVIQYYKAIGFDFTREDWGKTAQEFIANYNSFLPESTIFPEAMELLEYFQLHRKKQFILSAMEQNMLNQSTHDLAITSYFEEISGIDNIFAASKIENGKKLIESHNLFPDEVCLLGDTAHDFDVSRELECHCILIASGHQSYEKLKQTGCSRIIQDLSALLNGAAIK